MNENKIKSRMISYAENNKNYNGWRETHARAFGSLFSEAFAGNGEAQIHLTAALNRITQRDFSGAEVRLAGLEKHCAGDFDRAALAYFRGLNAEMMGNEEQMNGFYEAACGTSVRLSFPAMFAPYFRTAKLAQKEFEMSRAMHYFEKALSVLPADASDAQSAAVRGNIFYEMAASFLTMHRYEEAERYLSLSREASPDEHPQREYIQSLLYAVRGEEEKSTACLEAIQNPLLKTYGVAAARAILAGTDLHYTAVPQDRSAHGDFCRFVQKNDAKLRRWIAGGKTDKAEALLSKELTALFPFMQRELACRIEPQGTAIVVKCKHYCVKTLIAEHEALFALPDMPAGWTFESVMCFAEYR